MEETLESCQCLHLKQKKCRYTEFYSRVMIAKNATYELTPPTKL